MPGLVAEDEGQAMGVDRKARQVRQPVVEAMEPRQLLAHFYDTGFRPIFSDQGGPATLTVVRTSAAEAEEIRVTTGGTAVAGVDYLPLPETLSFAPGEGEKQVPVVIRNRLD